MNSIEQQNTTIQLVRSILGDSYSELRVRQVNIEEDLVQQITRVSCEITDEVSGEQMSISGEGVGAVDALFQAMMTRFATEYPSLKSVKLHSFTVNAHIETRQKEAGTDSTGEVVIDVVNSEGKVFRFSHTSRSVLGSVLITTLMGLRYFLNSERAFLMVYGALKDARERNRQDLVQKYTDQLAVLVQNTSYSEAINKFKKEIGKE